MIFLIDASNLSWFQSFVWRAYRKQKSWYARTSICANGKTRWVYMHRLAALTPFGQICHHRNRDSTDNRFANLLNMTKNEHQLLHQNNSLTIKFEEKSPLCPDTQA